MTSCYFASTPTRGNWFQTNQPEHELDDHAGDPAISVCVFISMRKIWHFRGGTSAANLINFCHCDAVKPKLQSGQGYWFLCDMISKIY